MSEKVLVIYCFLDDFFLETNHRGSCKPQANPKVSASIVLPTAILSVRFLGGNQASAVLYLANKQGGRCHAGKLTFNQRLQRLASILSALFYYLTDSFKALNLSGYYLIDSFPASVCNVFNQITMRFPKKTHALTEAGFLIKTVFFLLAYALETSL